MSSAIISDCGKYRYTLHRWIPQPIRWIKPVLFILINPSTADGVKEDRTSKRCLEYAKSWGCTEMTIVNLFAFRSTFPTDLLEAEDPVGPDNDKHIKEQIEKNTLGNIFLGWGNFKLAKTRAPRIKELLDGRAVKCFAQNKDGSPKHPLYCRADLQGIDFQWK